MTKRFASKTFLFKQTCYAEKNHGAHLHVRSIEREGRQLQRYASSPTLHFFLRKNRPSQALRRLRVAPTQALARHQARKIHGFASIRREVKQEKTPPSNRGSFFDGQTLDKTAILCNLNDSKRKEVDSFFLSEKASLLGGA